MHLCTRRSRRRCFKPAAGLVSLLVLGAVLVACAALPDTSGYTAATIQVKQAVAAAGDAVAAEIEAGAHAVPKESSNRQVLLNNAGAFRAAWENTVGSLDAMVSYAESIESIVDAGNKGVESAEAVAGAVQRLANAIVMDPVTGATKETFDTATTTVSFIYGEIAKARAAESLEKAISEIGPAVVGLNQLVQLQLKEARRLFVLSVGLERDELRTGEAFGQWLKMDRQLSQRERVLLAQLTDLDTAETRPARAPSRDEISKQMKNIESDRKYLAPKLAQFQELNSALTRRDRAGLALLAASETALRAWAAAHDKLVRAVAERKPVTMESLNSAVVEIQKLIQRWREL
jgi:hypothetical protein